MNIPTITASDFTPLLPTLVLALGAIVLLISEVFLTSASSRSYQSVFSALTAALAGAVALGIGTEPSHNVFLGFGVLDPFSSALTVVVCVAAFLASLMAEGFLRQRNAERGEFYALTLFGAAGMSLLAMSNELITLFISLELMSVATYALAAYLRRGPRPSEAAFKYFILGAFSGALLLYGAALLYGVTGSTMLPEIATRLAGPRGAFATAPALTYAAIALIAAGFAFKVAAVPFHMWTPDVYEGAPTPVTAFMSAGVKAAAFASLVRVFGAFAPSASPKLMLGLFTMLALLTMVIGNLLAIPQRNVKRMLAYSSIAHAGYLLLGVATLFAHPSGKDVKLLEAVQLTGASPLEAIHHDALRGILFYLFGYTVTVVGAFGLVAAVERKEDEDKEFAWDLDQFAGLATRRPWWALAMALFMLSLGGIPPTVGFMAKLLIFRSAVDAGLIGLAIVGVLSSAAGVYYYLRVVVYMYMRPAPEGAHMPARHWGTEVALVLSSLAVIGFGVAPGWATGWLTQAGSIWLGMR
jgi:NADH-quinone oxidoreductase subunit N